MTATVDIAGLVEPTRVNGSVYLDDAIFAAEIDRIFERHWVFIGHAGEIPQPGDFRQRRIGRQPVIFVRDQQGLVRVLMNRCTHRANAVCHEERGTAKGFTCPYHGWRFRLNGALAAIPYSDRYSADFDKGTLGLREVRSEAHRGFVFATLNRDDIPLTDHLGPHVMAELDDIADLSPEGELQANAGVHRLRYAGNWKLQVENVIDGYHANFAHRSHADNVKARTGFDMTTLATSSAPATVRDLGNGHCSWDSSALLAGGSRTFNQAGADVQRSYEDSLVAAHGRERVDHVLGKGGTHLYIWPNFSFVGAHFRIFQPIATAETQVQLVPLMLKGAPPEINSRRLRTHEVFYGPAGGGQSDDLEIFERNQIGLAARHDPWSLLSRGAHLEERRNDGTVTGQITDELPNRAIWRKWAEVMSEPVPA